MHTTDSRVVALLHAPETEQSASFCQFTSKESTLEDAIGKQVWHERRNHASCHVAKSDIVDIIAAI